MQPIFDNVEYLFSLQEAEGSVRGYQELMNLGILEFEPLTMSAAAPSRTSSSSWTRRRTCLRTR